MDTQHFGTVSFCNNEISPKKRFGSCECRAICFLNKKPRQIEFRALILTDSPGNSLEYIASCLNGIMSLGDVCAQMHEHFNILPYYV